ncbi:hypothetical protein ACOSP7_004564 [Xanthoceras sorbifolium]
MAKTSESQESSSTALVRRRTSRLTTRSTRTRRRRSSRRWLARLPLMKTTLQPPTSKRYAANEETKDSRNIGCTKCCYRC